MKEEAKNTRFKAKVEEVKKEETTNQDGETNRSFKHKIESPDNIDINWIKIKSDKKEFEAGTEIEINPIEIQEQLE